LKIHHEILRTGLDVRLEFKEGTDDPRLAPFIGTVVRYKRELLTPDFVRTHGQIAVVAEFVVRHTQVDYRGRRILRGYALYGNDFGSPLDPDHVEIVRVASGRESA
jgi:hypothetical protein